MNTYYFKASVGTLMTVSALLWWQATKNSLEEEIFPDLVPLADVDPDLLRGASTRFFYPVEPPKDTPSQASVEHLLKDEI